MAISTLAYIHAPPTRYSRKQRPKLLQWNKKATKPFALSILQLHFSYHDCITVSARRLKWSARLTKHSSV